MNNVADIGWKVMIRTELPRHCLLSSVACLSSTLPMQTWMKSWTGSRRVSSACSDLSLLQPSSSLIKVALDCLPTRVWLNAVAEQSRQCVDIYRDMMLLPEALTILQEEFCVCHTYVCAFILSTAESSSQSQLQALWEQQQQAAPSQDAQLLLNFLAKMSENSLVEVCACMCREGLRT